MALQKLLKESAIKNNCLQKEKAKLLEKKRELEDEVESYKSKLKRAEFEISRRRDSSEAHVEVPSISSDEVKQ